MPVPSPRNKLLPARGEYLTLEQALPSLFEGEFVWANNTNKYYQVVSGALQPVTVNPNELALVIQSVSDVDAKADQNAADIVLNSQNIVAEANLRVVNDTALQNQINSLGDDATGLTARVGQNEQDIATNAAAITNIETNIDSVEETLDAKADLVDGLVPTSQLPGIAISEFLGEVADEVAMLALTGEKGDWCIRSDVSDTYVITGDDPSLLVNWTELATPASPVTSVNGQVGAVVLGAADVGAIPATDAPNFAPNTLDLQGVTDNGSATTLGATFGGSVNLALVRVVASGTTYPRLIGTPDGTLYSESSAGVYPWQFNPNGSIIAAGAINTTGDDSYYSVNRTNQSGGAALYLGFTDGDQKFKVGIDGSIAAAGSATFAGTVKSDSYFESARTNNSTASAFYATLDGVQGVDIKASGDATFEGNVAGAAFTSSGSFQLTRGNGAQVTMGGSDTYAVWAKDDAFVLKHDGSAVFGGDIQMGADANSGVNAGLYFYADEGCITATGNTAGQNLLLGYTAGSSTSTVAITAAGDATFKGDITSELNADYKSVVAPNGTIALYGGGSLVTYLQNDGSASFASTIIAGGSALSGGAAGVSLYPTGGIHATQASGTSTILSGYIQGSSTKNVAITAAGDATFKGDVQVGDEEPWNVTDANASWIGQGNIELYRDVAGPSNGFIQGYTQVGGGTRKNAFSIYADGSGKFAGTLSVSGQNTINEASTLKFSQETNAKSQIRAYGPDASTKGSLEFKVSPTSGAALTPLTLNSDGSATLGGDVTVGDYQSGTAGKNGFQFRSSGELVQNRNGGDAYTLYNNSSTKTVTISAAGAGTFKDYVRSGNSSTYTQVDSFNGLQVINSDITKVTIGMDGAATFKNSTYGAYTFISHRPAATAFSISGGSTNDVTDPEWYITPSGNIKTVGRITADSGLDVYTSQSYWLRVGSSTKTNVIGFNDGRMILGGTLDPTFATVQSPNIYLNSTSGSATFTSTIECNTGKKAEPGIKATGNYGGANYASVVARQYTPTGYNFVGRNSGGTTTFSVNEAGTATFIGSVTAQGALLTSDRRFKTDITDASSQLDDVVALGNSLRNWNWTDEAPVADKETRFLGLIAQEAEEICPGIVTTIERDDDSHKAIKNDVLVMKLLGAVAELKAEVEDLKQKLAEA